MLALHELHDIAKIVAASIQMRLRAGQRQAASGVGSEAAQMPSLDELAEGRYSRVLLQGAKGRDAKPALILKLHDLRIGIILILANNIFWKPANLHLFSFVYLSSLSFPFPDHPPAIVHH